MAEQQPDLAALRFLQLVESLNMQAMVGMGKLADPLTGKVEKELERARATIDLLEALTEQLGLALEGARLYQEAQQRAARERLTREITDQMRRATNVEDVVRTAVDELFGMLDTSRAFVRLGVTQPTQGSDGDRNDGRKQ